MEQTVSRERAPSTASSTTAGQAKGHVRAKSSAKSPSSAIIALFLTNLRLLDFDLLPDWPAITATSLIGNQDARARIRCSEFALFHLFQLYDPHVTADRLQPFYPPLEPLQSINLRAALYRCLNELKKNGILGRETVLRKSMLDDCQGDKFWELCLAFSAIVLRKVTLQKKHTYAHHRYGGPVAERLGTATGLSKGQKESLIPLAIAHRASLGKVVEEKKKRKRETFGRLYEVLVEKEAELARRRVEVQERARSRPSQAQVERLEAVDRQARQSWVGRKELQEVLLNGQQAISGDTMLARPLDKLVESPKEDRQADSLLQALEQTARRQSQRVRRWQSMHEQLLASKQASSQANGPPKDNDTARLRFDKHRSLSLQEPTQPHTNATRTRSDSHAVTTKYDEMLTAMREELRRNRKEVPPSPVKPTPTIERRPTRKPSVHLDTSAGARDPHQRSPSRTAVPMRPGMNRRISSRSRSYHQPKVDGQRQHIPLKSEIFSPLKRDRDKRGSGTSPLSSSPLLATPVEDVACESLLGDSDRAGSRRVSQSSEGNGEADSGVGMSCDEVQEMNKHDSHRTDTSSSSDDADAEIIKVPERDFKKPALPASSSDKPAATAARPSLAERTRMSMAFRSSDDITGTTTSAPPLSTPPLSTTEEQAPRRPTSAELATTEAQTRRTTLLERTRQSISLAPDPAVQKQQQQQRAAHSRTRSSIVYPVNQFDNPPPKSLPRRSSVGVNGGDANVEGAGTGTGVETRRRDITPREQLFSPDAEYDSVFKPRPKIKMSPVLSPFQPKTEREAMGGGRELEGLERGPPTLVL